MGRPPLSRSATDKKSTEVVWRYETNSSGSQIGGYRGWEGWWGGKIYLPAHSEERDIRKPTQLVWR